MAKKGLTAGSVLLLVIAGCSRPAAEVPLVRWRDAAGAEWQAPLKTPPADDPIWKEHPGAGVVLRCAKTGVETIVADPDAWLAYRGRPNSPFKSKAGAPLVLADQPVGKAAADQSTKR